jgi:HEPN domain-containing protein
MSGNDRVKYWLDLAEDDLKTVQWLLKGERLLPAGFFCHLIAEKALKAAIEHNTCEIPPKIHDLKKLAKRSDIFKFLSDEQLKLLIELEPLQIEGRYPEHKERIAKMLTLEKTEQLFKETEEFLCWIKKELEKSPEDMPPKLENF